ncbi:MAG: methyltransferase domain-containing protein [Streptosporangiaceae bacterium]
MSTFQRRLSHEGSGVPGTVSVDDDGLRVPASQGGVIDVLFDGRRVWSVAPGDHSKESGGGYVRVRWPRPLRRFLDGVTRVTLREHRSGDVLFDGEHRFGSRPERVRVVDDAGRALMVDKVGHLEHPFEASDTAAVESLLDRLGDAFEILHAECQLPAFLAYGALLGAVREGKLIGHDSDIDISYLSRYDNPLDVGLESFRIQRAMRRHGFEVRRFSSGTFKIRFPISGGIVQAVDIFAGFMCEGRLHVMPRLRVPLRRSDIVPLGRAELEGRGFPAPADPERFLAAAYGEHWGVPDPSWRPEAEASTRRWFDGWTRGLRTHRDQWESSFGPAARGPVAEEPSPFARWVAEREAAPIHVVDVGSGAGRDAVWLARAGHRVTALDYAYNAVACGRQAAGERSAPVAFEFFNLYELRQVLATGARLARLDDPVVLCGRLVVDAVEDEGRENFWRLARMALRPGRRLYLEFRTGGRRGRRGPAGLFVRPLRAETVVGEIEAYGGAVEHWERVRVGDASGDPGPHGCRLVARW